MNYLFELNDLLTEYECSIEPAFDKENECYKKIANCKNNFNKIRTLLARDIMDYNINATTEKSVGESLDRLTRHYEYYKKWKAKTEKSYTQELLSIVFAYGTAIQYYATALFYEAADNEFCTVTSLLEKFGSDCLSHAADAMDRCPSFEEKRKSLCSGCNKQECSNRINEYVAKEDDAPEIKENLIARYPVIRDIFDRLVAGGYLHDDYSINCEIRCAAVIAKAIATKININNYNFVFSEFWGLKSRSLVQSINDIKGTKLDGKQKRYYPVLDKIFMHKNNNGELVTERKKSDDFFENNLM